MYIYCMYICGELRFIYVGEMVCLFGWVYCKCDYGGLLFIDFCDYYGII